MRCGYCGVDHGGRPYSRAGDGVPSVTQVLGVANFGDKARKFGWAASEISAVLAVHEGETWADLGTSACSHDHAVEPGLCPACKFLRSAHDRKWRAKASLGNHVHFLAECWSKGEPADVDPVTGPFMDGLAQWYVDAEPAFVLTEATLLADAAKVTTYRGTCDVVAVINCPVCPGNRCTWLLDYKTTEGFWDLEWRLQLAAYRHADWVTLWEGKTETKARKMPLVAHAGILQLLPGSYRMEELEVGQTEHNVFLMFRHAWAWERQAEMAAKEKAKQDTSPALVPVA